MTAGTETATWIAVVKYAWYAWAVTYFEAMWDIDRAMCALWILMLSDIVTWWAKAKRMKNPITSDKTIYWVTKKLLIILLIGLVWITFIGLGKSPDHVLGFMIPILIVAELYSCVQNVYAFMTWVEKNEQDVIEKLLSVTADSLYQILDSMAKNASNILKKRYENDSGIWRNGSDGNDDRRDAVE